MQQHHTKSCYELRNSPYFIGFPNIIHTYADKRKYSNKPDKNNRAFCELQHSCGNYNSKRECGNRIFFYFLQGNTIFFQFPPQQSLSQHLQQMSLLAFALFPL